MPDSGGAAKAVAERMADAAQAVLAGLAGSAREQAGWAWSGEPDTESDLERRRWFYTPTDHGGLAVADMAPAQYRRVMALVASGLSEAGYGTVAAVMGLENILDRTEGFAGPSFDRARGRDPGQYRLRIFGRPGEPLWGWRFGGHHVSLNYLVAGGEVVAATPCFLGADPAGSPLLGGAVLRPLGRTEELARELIGSLAAERLAETVLTPRAPVDIVGGNRPTVGPGDRVIPLDRLFRGRLSTEQDRRMAEGHRASERHGGITEADHAAVALTERPRGLSATGLEHGQRELLRELLGCYFGRLPEPLARAHAARYAEAGLDGVHFAWAGGLTPDTACYYRIQGPRLLIEYDNTQRQANHAHAAWRDPERDFGADVLAAHHRTHHE